MITGSKIRPTRWLVRLHANTTGRWQTPLGYYLSRETRKRGKIQTRRHSRNWWRNDAGDQWPIRSLRAIKMGRRIATHVIDRGFMPCRWRLIYCFVCVFRYYLANTEKNPEEQYLYRTSLNDKKTECLSCKPSCKYSRVEMNVENNYYTLICNGPNVPEVEIYKMVCLMHDLLLLKIDTNKITYTIW